MQAGNNRSFQVRQADQEDGEVEKNEHKFKTAVSGSDEIGIAARKQTNQRAGKDQRNCDIYTVFNGTSRDWKPCHIASQIQGFQLPGKSSTALGAGDKLTRDLRDKNMTAAPTPQTSNASEAILDHAAPRQE